MTTIRLNKLPDDFARNLKIETGNASVSVPITHYVETNGGILLKYYSVHKAFIEHNVLEYNHSQIELEDSEVDKIKRLVNDMVNSSGVHEDILESVESLVNHTDDEIDVYDDGIKTVERGIEKYEIKSHPNVQMPNKTELAGMFSQAKFEIYYYVDRRKKENHDRDRIIVVKNG